MKLLPLFLLCFFAVSLQAIDIQSIEEKSIALFEDEVSSLETLIHSNERALSIQKALKEKMQEFQQQKKEFILGNQTNSHAFTMVSNARSILSTIKEEHLSYLFSVDYLEELIFFSSIAAKNIPLKPET